LGTGTVSGGFFLHAAYPKAPAIIARVI